MQCGCLTVDQVQALLEIHRFSLVNDLTFVLPLVILGHHLMVLLTAAIVAMRGARTEDIIALWMHYTGRFVLLQQLILRG